MGEKGSPITCVLCRQSTHHNRDPLSRHGELALSFATTFRKLRAYFQAHTIQVLTNFPLKQILQKLKASGRLMKWVVKLSEFDLVFKIRTPFKGQTLADLIVDFTHISEMEKEIEHAKPSMWNLFVVGSLRDTGSGFGVVLVSQEGYKLNCVVKFNFKATNNVAEFETLLTSLRLVKEMQMKRLVIISVSQLVASQVNGKFLAKDNSTTIYLKLITKFVLAFEMFKLAYILLVENAHADILLKLASSKDYELFTVVPIEHLIRSFTSKCKEVIWVEDTPL